MTATASTLVLEQVPRPLYVDLMQQAARRGLPVGDHVRALLIEVALRPDPAED